MHCPSLTRSFAPSIGNVKESPSVFQLYQIFLAYLNIEFCAPQNGFIHIRRAAYTMHTMQLKVQPLPHTPSDSKSTRLK